MTQPDTLDDEARAVIVAYGAAARSGDLDSYMSLFHEDAIQCSPPAVGRTAIRDKIARIREGRGNPGNPTFQIEPEHVDIVGDLAIVMAHPQWGGEQPRDLTAMFVLRRDTDRWLIWRQMVTTQS